MQVVEVVVRSHRVLQASSGTRLQACWNGSHHDGTVDPGNFLSFSNKLGLKDRSHLGADAAEPVKDL